MPKAFAELLDPFERDNRQTNFYALSRKPLEIEQECLNSLTQREGTFCTEDDFPKIDFEKPLNKSILSKDLEKIVDKDCLLLSLLSQLTFADKMQPVTTKSQDVTRIGHVRARGSSQLLRGCPKSTRQGKQQGERSQLEDMNIK